ncbi:MAG: hypothetical protein OEW93_01290, partial [Candidatus Bathyarchaeota archaeon]|nr:hypothetical protein [Candidatus Bathyarchaeota archaeon]
MIARREKITRLPFFIKRITGSPSIDYLDRRYTNDTPAASAATASSMKRVDAPELESDSGGPYWSITSPRSHE